MTKLRKEIMKRSKLRNKFNRNRNHQNWYNFKIQRNYCRKRFRKTKKQHYKNLGVQDVTENQIFQKTGDFNFQGVSKEDVKKEIINSQLAFTCSKSTTKTLAKGVKYVKS